MDPRDRRQQPGLIQLLNPLAVGLLERLQDRLVVLKALGQVASPVNERPDRDLPWLHIRIVAVPQNVHPRKRPRGEERPQMPLDRIRHCVIHVALLEVRAI